MVDLSVVNRQTNAVSSCMFSHEGGYLEGTGYVIVRQGPQPTYAMCDVLNEAAGIAEDDWQNRRYPSTGMESLKFILVKDGRLFREEGSERVLEECEETRAEILRQRAEDVETQRARLCLADDLAKEWGGSQEAFVLFQSAIWFDGGDPGEGWEREEGATFWQVGRNASHSFHMGLRQDEDGLKLFKGWYEPEWLDRDGNTCGGWEQKQVERFEGYFGHG